jgi:hypothetical protein
MAVEKSEIPASQPTLGKVIREAIRNSVPLYFRPITLFLRLSHQIFQLVLKVPPHTEELRQALERREQFEEGSVPRDDRLVAEVTASQDAGESMDVLLQLTLPIVLILAYVVVTEVRTLQGDLAGLQRDVRQTPTGELRGELDVAVLTLQQQLLLQATDEIAQEERDRLGLAEYKLAAPSVDEVLNKRVDERFARISKGLAERFNGPEGRLRTHQRLRQAVAARFEQLVQQVLAQHPALGQARRQRLQEISDDNRRSYETKLDGHLSGMQEEGQTVQLKVVWDWTTSPRTGPEVEAESKALWEKIQTEKDEAVGHDLAKRFVTLKAQKLVGRFKAMGVPLLEETLRRVLS